MISFLFLFFFSLFFSFGICFLRLTCFKFSLPIQNLNKDSGYNSLGARERGRRGLLGSQALAFPKCASVMVLSPFAKSFPVKIKKGHLSNKI